MLSFLEYTELTERQLFVGDYDRSSQPLYNNVYILAGGSGCFDGDTLVKTQSGYKPISQIQENEMVYTFNEETQSKELNYVKEVFEYPSFKEMIELTFENSEKIICTLDHDFFVNGKWIQAKDLKCSNGFNVTSKKIIEHTKNVFDLSIENNHNYYITKSDFLVHNSGKDFILQNVLNLHAKVFDVDEVKTSILKAVKQGKMKDLSDEFLQKTGRDINSLKLSQPSDVSLFHQFIKDKGLDDKPILNFLNAQKDLKTKSNVVFNVTLKDTDKLKEISDLVTSAGYKKENIHIIWILTRLETAILQNLKRERKVDQKILFNSHKGAGLTIKELLKNNEKYRKYADGEIWIVVNTKDIETIIKQYYSEPASIFGREKGKKNFFVEKYTSAKVKERKRKSMLPVEVDEKIKDMINRYAPKIVDWEDKNA